MMYKGNDLDLRTPWRPSQDRMRADTGYRPHIEAGRGVPISVDQTVLAASNGAYDAAVFFATREVRPEHLLYAFTRVDAARDILEQHGVHTQQLRRETVAMMGTVEPGAAWDGRGSPPASPEFEELLRRAAARAGQDGVAASVQDVMRAVLSGGREAGMAALLLHAAADPQSLERWATEPVLPLHLGAPQSLQLASLQPDATEKLGARLDQVESAMRALVSGLADIQQGIDGRIAEIGASIARLAERFDAVRAFSSDAPDVDGRLAALETRIAAQPPAIAEAVSYMLGQRTGGEEDVPPASGMVAERLASLEATLRAQTERMDEVSKTHEHDLTEVYEALVKIGGNQQTLASNLDTWRLDSGGDIGIVSNRVERMEQALLAVLPRARPEPAPQPQPVQPAAEPARVASDDVYEGEPPTGSFKRWLFGTTRVLPSSWREDMTALRQSLPRRRNGSA
jgi:uncharacterized coiled-coil protein SlyX